MTSTSNLFTTIPKGQHPPSNHIHPPSNHKHLFYSTINAIIATISISIIFISFYIQIKMADYDHQLLPNSPTHRKINKLYN